MKNEMVKIELLETTDAGTRAITAVKRPVKDAKSWADEKNSKLDFYGNRCWVICK